MRVYRVEVRSWRGLRARGAVALRDAGWSYRQIADALGYSTEQTAADAVYRLRRRANSSGESHSADAVYRVSNAKAPRDGGA